MPTDPKREISIRRRFLTLLRLERRLAHRIAEARAAGITLNGFIATECSSIHWALEQLGYVFPQALVDARADLARDAERRRERGGGNPA